MASASSIWDGVITFFLGIFVSIIFFISIVYPSERVLTAFETFVVLPGGGTIYDVPAPWNMGYTDALFWMDLMYIVAVSPAILGLLIMFLSAIRTQSYDIFGTTADEQLQSEQMPLNTYTPTIIPQSNGGIFK